MSDIEKTANDLLEKFSDSSEEAKKVNKVLEYDPYVDLKKSLLDFFKDRMNRITVQERLKERIEQELETLVDNGDLTFDQLLRLHSQVAKSNNVSTDSFLTIFKPTPGAPSILAENLAKQDERKDEFDEMYESLSSEQLRKLDKLSKLLQVMSDEEKEDS